MRPRGGQVVPFMVLLLLLAGCIGPAAPATLDEAQGNPPAAPRVVVALIDSGINPWHEAFATDAPLPASLRDGVEPIPVEFRERVAAEGLVAWNRLEPDQLYWFEGTRVLAISKLQRISEEIRPLEALFPPDPHRIFDDFNHGTATASVVARLSPHAWIVMVETSALSLNGYLWASEQPWVDIISTSEGKIANLPHNETSDRDAFADALQRAVLTGKMVVAAADNTPSPHLLGFSAAPWVIGVGGAEGDERGLTVLSSTPVDVVANFTWSGLARNRSDNETFSSKGTSFGTPAVAAVLAEAIYELRSRAGHVGGIVDGALVVGERRITNADLRWALNMSASYWEPGEHEPDINTSQSPFGVAYELTAPALPHVAGTPVGPWVQMGWGFVDATTTGAIVALLEGRAEAPDKVDAAAYLQQLFELRSALWDARQRAP